MNSLHVKHKLELFEQFLEKLKDPLLVIYLMILTDV